MALLMLKNDDLYNFETADDVFTWLQIHYDDDDKITILGEHDDTPLIEAYLDTLYPIRIM